MAVSYTHLDVYKRQALYSELFDGHIGTVLDAARDEARRAQVDKACLLYTSRCV